MSSELEFYTSIAPLMQEYEDSYAIRQEDPTRYQEAKQAFFAARSFYRLLSQAVREYMRGDETLKADLETLGIPIEVSPEQEEIHEFNVIVNAGAISASADTFVPGGN